MVFDGATTMRITARLMNGTRRRSAVMIATIAMAVSASTLSAAQAHDWPKFRKGMWRFERTLEIGGQYVILPAASRLLWKREMTRCVDPSEAMKESFSPISIGNSRSVEPQLIENRYVFPLRGDYMGPVRTVIAVESDGAYTDINELSVGNFPYRRHRFQPR